MVLVHACQADVLLTGDIRDFGFLMNDRKKANGLLVQTVADFFESNLSALGMNQPTIKPCPFCHLDPNRILAEDELTVIYKDGFPLSLGHTVIIPKRHITTLFDATGAEQLALLKALNDARAILEDAHHPDGYNIGINQGAAAGQTVAHLHVHLIPRYQGDMEDPRGGVRWVLPQKAKYWK